MDLKCDVKEYKSVDRSWSCCRVGLSICMCKSLVYTFIADSDIEIYLIHQNGGRHEICSISKTETAGLNKNVKLFSVWDMVFRGGGGVVNDMGENRITSYPAKHSSS